MFCEDFDSSLNVATKNVKNEKQKNAKIKREKLTKKIAIKHRFYFRIISTFIKIILFLFFIDCFFCICVFKNFLLFNFSFDCSQNYLKWFVEKYCFKFKINIQTCFTNYLLQLNSWLENITINDLRKSIKFIDRSHFTLIQSIFISIVLKNCQKNQSSIFIFIFWWFCSYCHFFYFFLNIVKSSMSIFITYSKNLRKIESRIFFVDCVTTILLKKSIWSKFIDINWINYISNKKIDKLIHWF